MTPLHCVSDPGEEIAYRGETTRVPKKGHDAERVVYEVIERTILANGQRLCVPEIEVATYWCNVEATPEEVLPTYPEHGTMEQFHSLRHEGPRRERARRLEAWNRSGARSRLVLKRI